MSVAKKAVYAAAIKVVPPPTSVLESTAILAKLKTFGVITYFSQTGKRWQLPSWTSANYKVHFEHESDRDEAHKQRDFEVEFVPNHPDPDGVDFYDVFGYQSRQYPQKQTFKCTLSTCEDSHEPYRKPKLSRHAGSNSLFESLYWSGAPENMRAGLSLHPTFNQYQHHDLPAATKDTKYLRPMELYRKALAKRNNTSGERTS